MKHPFHASADDLARLVDAQATVIDLLGRNAPFDDFLVTLCDLFRRQIEGAFVSILLPTDDGTALAAGIGLDLDDGIYSTTQEIPIAEGSLTSGTAAFRRQSVVSSDIATDPLWINRRERAAASGIGACWSTPLIGTDDHLLGVLAILWPHPATPTDRQRWLHKQFARIATTVIERYRSQLSVSQMLADERRAFAQDLHDDPIQAVTAVSLRLQRLLPSATDEQRAQLSEIQTTVFGAIDRMRSMLFELHPPTLDDEGLVSAIELYLFERIDPLGIEWELHNRLAAEPSSASASLAYRLAREALSNVAHHSQAKRLDVTLESGTGGLHVRVVDDGVGCDIETATHGRAGHLGTVSSRYLAERASGRWAIDSVPNEGTTVEFWIPLGRYS